MKYLLSLLFAGLLLAGCSSNPRAIEPNDLERFDAQYKVERQWRASAGRGVRKSNLTLRPAVTAQQVIAGDVEGRVYAFQRDDGKRQWRKRTDDRISGGFYAGYGVVLYGTREGDAVALSLESGELLWRTRLSSEVLALPHSDGRLAVFQSQDGRISALDLETGELRWDYEAQVPTLTLRSQTQPLLHQGRVYVGLPNARLLALEARNGNVLWEQRIAEPKGRSELDRLIDVGANLIAQGGGIFASTYQGQVAVVDEDDGRPYWGREMSSAQVISAGAGQLYINDHTAVVRALDLRSGSTLWMQDALYGRRMTGTAYQNGLVLVGDYRGYLHWLSAEDGELAARRRHDRKGFAGTPVGYDGSFYVLGNRGRLSAYRLVPR